MITAALAGNPNVGKSTVFNALTGMKQHTGNWAGKTVGTAEGQFTVDGETVTLVDLPGIYSLACHSPEEEAARDFIVNERPDCVICVCDASALERNLILAGQLGDLTQEIGGRLILCVNLIDEAEKRGIKVDAAKLSAFFGCPVILTAARQGIGLEELKRAAVDAGQTESSRVMPCQHCEGCAGCSSDDRHAIRAEEAVRYAVTTDSGKEKRARREERWDRFLCGRFTSIPVMLFLIAAVFWLTLSVSGRLSDGLGWLLDFILSRISSVLAPILPGWLWSLLCGGILATVFRVTAVMLPPMAVFFPAFTLLEDLGYLPRAAFCLDRCFAACGSCGKQSLTMLMGLGCNAAGVTGCRIIDSPRERLIAILTNSLVPCNGRFPLLLACLGCLGLSAGWSAVGLTAVLLLAVGMTLAVSKLLSVTILRGQPSSFTLELPPYRIPQIGPVIVRSLLDRTIFVLGRAVTAAAPCGALIWLAFRWEIGGIPLYERLTALLDPIGRFAGMDGRLMVSFLFALPAAELMLPLALANGGDFLAEIGDIPAAFSAHGWGSRTVCCVMLFMLFHFPCATTLMTIKKETGQTRWAVLAAVLPTVIGYGLCVIVRAVTGIFG